MFGSYLLLLLLSQFHFCPFAAAEGYDGATSGCFIENTLKLICSVVRCRYVYLLQAIVSGLTFATLLTLVTTPAMLAIPHQIKGIARRLRSMRGSAADQLASDSVG